MSKYTTSSDYFGATTDEVIDSLNEEIAEKHLMLVNERVENKKLRIALQLILDNSLGFNFAFNIANRALNPKHYCNDCGEHSTPDDADSKCESCGAVNK